MEKIGGKLPKHLKEKMKKQCDIHVVGCTLCGNDFNKLKKNNNAIRYCSRCDKAV